MDRTKLCDCLLTWIQTFDLDPAPSTVEDLTDGVVIAQVLHQITPKFFTDGWMSKIKSPDTADNWRLKVSNLKKIVKGVMDYNTEALAQTIQDFHMPNVNAIGEQSDPEELGRLLQLILGVAVNCSNKQEYIQVIMSLEESVQHMVMQAIQELMTKEAPASQSTEGVSELNEQVKRLTEDLQSTKEQREEYAQRCHELDMQVAALQEEKTSLVTELDKLNERVNQADSLDDPSTPVGRKYQQVQNQVELLQEELERTEANKDDLRIKIELQEKEMFDLQQKNEELSLLAEESRRMKDEVYELQLQAEKAVKYEASIESFKKRLEEMSDLRQQLRLLEEKNTTYMQKNMELEEEVRKGTSVRNQLDTYKRQVQELQMKHSDETKRADKAEFEAKRLGDKMTTLQREKESLVAERDSLKEMNEELRCTQIQQDLHVNVDGAPSELLNLGAEISSTLVTDTLTSSSGTDVASGDFGDSDSLELMSLPPQVKERILRLEHENKLLRLQRSEKENEEGELVQSMLDDANARKNELESENRIANQRILELEAQIEDLQEASRGAASSEETAQLRKQLKEQIQKVKELNDDLSKKKAALDEMEPRLAESTASLTQLKEQLAKKETEMREMEEKYRKYLEKAKAVIRSLDPKQAQSSSTEPELVSLRNQLQEKERLIEHMQKEYEKAKNIRDQEEKLIVTAWYNLGMNLHRKAVDDRLSHSTGQSFLARQRQAHMGRRTTNTSNPHGSR